MDWVTWINTAVGIIGIIVGIIGWKSLTTATKINNTAEASSGASIQQAQTINNGLDSYAVIRLSKDTTQDELIRLIKEINLASKNDVESAIEVQVSPAKKQITELEEKIDALPKIHVGPTAPPNFRTGDFWLDTSE